MYTDGVKTLRRVAFVLALLVAAGPVIGVACELDCETPSTRSSGCHDVATRGGDTMRPAAHACGHAHVAEPGAMRPGVSGRDQHVPFVSALWHRASAFSPAAVGAAALAFHGPPGVTARSISSLATVLRI